MPNSNHYQERTTSVGLQGYIEAVRALTDIKEGVEITICYRLLYV